ncbi:transglutaminase domain-containing protein [Butyrivibrio sp. FC2001]|uniref:transglutaminase domain-containing protein n=1 Tax=Butyrivibrio sp. FC2001 TaxID=1280671 RepID=UPI000401E0F0|nr:transglutaminase domain-containing protein [Butyrivibrio sp. FC2001]
MKKDRCFKNLIGKASVFFAFLCMCTMLTACSSVNDSVSDFFQDNNLLNDGDKIGFGKKDKSVAGEAASTEESGEAKTDDTDSADAISTDNSDSSAAVDVSESTSAEESAPADSSAEADTSETAAESENTDDSAFDADKVNKAIDDLITQIEIETGRTGRRKEVEETEEEKGKDSTTYFSDSYQQKQRAEIGLSPVDIDEIKKSQEGNYAYEHLTNDGKTLYVELYKIIQNRAEDIVVSTLDEETLDVVCQFVLADHPEFFYMDGYTYTRYTVAGVLKKISFTGNYIYSAEQIAARQEKIDEYVQTCLAGVPSNVDGYTKVKYIYDYLITNTEYDADAPDNQNICSVFLYGRSVCQGYAKATQYLLNKLGIPTTLVTGKVAGVGHAWNLVLVDGEYTYVDTTWGDSSYQRFEAGGDSSQKLPLINYTYLCCTTQDINKTHTISETLPVPDCTSMRNNYYVREGEYFTENDFGALGELFKRRYSDGSNNVTIKCSTRAVYDEFIKNLITEQNVFGYMEGSNNTVSYTTFDEQYTLIIWLY